MSLGQIDGGYNIDDEAEDERLQEEKPDVFHEREQDKWLHEVELQEAARRRLTKN
jgi:hypothetical protein